MLLTRLRSVLPSRQMSFTIVFSSVLGGVVAIGSSAWLRPGGSIPSPQPPSDPRYAQLGRDYLSRLGKAYAGAWAEGAKTLDGGQGISAALDVVAKTWTSNRTELYDKVITPKFSKIVAESTKDADVTPQERAAMAAAWRGLALGLIR